MLPPLNSALPAALMSPTRPSQLLQKANAPLSASATTENDKIDKSAKEFESLLLTNWLQGAQESFASVPGGDEEADADPGSGQLQNLAMQSLGTALTASGGIGLAHSIAQLLHRSAGAPATSSAKVPADPVNFP